MLNQMQDWQQKVTTFQAMQRASQTMAGANTPEEGIAAIQRSPDAAFVQPLVEQYMQQQYIGAQTAQARQQTNFDALRMAYPQLANAQSTQDVENIINGSAANMDPAVSAAGNSMRQRLIQSLNEGNPNPDTIHTRALRLWLASGMASAEQGYGALGGLPPQAREVTLPGGGRGIAQIGGPSTIGAGQADQTGQPQQPSDTGGVPGAMTPGTMGVGGQQGPGTAGGTQDASGVDQTGVPPGKVAVPGASGRILLDEANAADMNYFEARGKDVATMERDLDKGVTNENNLMLTIHQAEWAMQHFKPGADAGTRATLARVAQVLHLGNNWVDYINQGDLGAYQDFEKVMLGAVMAQVESTLPGGSRLTEREWNEYRRANPQVNTDPRAIYDVFNFWTRRYQMDLMEQNWLNEYKGAKLPMSQWPSAWQQHARELGLFNPSYMVSRGALQGKPIDGLHINRLMEHKNDQGYIDDFNYLFGDNMAQMFINGNFGQMPKGVNSGRQQQPYYGQ